MPKNLEDPTKGKFTHDLQGNCGAKTSGNIIYFGQPDCKQTWRPEIVTDHHVHDQLPNSDGNVQPSASGRDL